MGQLQWVNSLLCPNVWSDCTTDHGSSHGITDQGSHGMSHESTHGEAHQVDGPPHELWDEAMEHPMGSLIKLMRDSHGMNQ